MIAHAPRLDRALSDRLDRGPAGRGRRGRTDRLHQGGRRRACRSSATTISSPTPIGSATRQAVGACNAVLVKPNQAGTLTETKAALRRRAGRPAGAPIVSARSGETEDVSIVHLAVGWGAKQLKVGSFTRSERMAKWNEGLRDRRGDRRRRPAAALRVSVGRPLTPVGRASGLAQHRRQERYGFTDPVRAVRRHADAASSTRWRIAARGSSPLSPPPASSPRSTGSCRAHGRSASSRRSGRSSRSTAGGGVRRSPRTTAALMASHQSAVGCRLDRQRRGF